MPGAVPTVLFTFVLPVALAVGVTAPGRHLAATLLVGGALAFRLALLVARRRALHARPAVDPLAEARAV